MISFILCLTLAGNLDGAEKKLEQAVNNISLVGKLPYVHAGLTDETMFSLIPTYYQNEMQFLQDSIEAEAVNSAGIIDTNSEWASFMTAFPTAWTNPDPTSTAPIEQRFTFKAKPLRQETSPITKLTFSYSYLIEERILGTTEISTSKIGEINIILAASPMTQWVLFREKSTLANGQPVYFAGSPHRTDIFLGPVLLNAIPYFAGRPHFSDFFASSVAESSWVEKSITPFVGKPDFISGSAGGSNYRVNVSKPLLNYAKLALENKNFDFSDPVVSLEGVQIPIDSENRLLAGIYIKGNSKIILDAVRGPGEIAAGEFSQLHPEDRDHCRFQRIEIESPSQLFSRRRILIGAENCKVVYDFSEAGAPKIYSGSLHGMIYVDGSIESIGSSRRTNAAVATNFSFNVVATGRIRITNDLQYEDALYFPIDHQGSITEKPVADPHGWIQCSKILPTQENLTPRIDSHSMTMLGLVSLKDSILIAKEAPKNLNLHSAMIALNTQVKGGCGFGAEEIKKNRGSLKFFGSLLEYRSQRLNRLKHNGGYRPIFAFDNRLRTKAPLGFPIGSTLQAYPSMISNFSLPK